MTGVTAEVDVAGGVLVGHDGSTAADEAVRYSFGEKRRALR